MAKEPPGNWKLLPNVSACPIHSMPMATRRRVVSPNSPTARLRSKETSPLRPESRKCWCRVIPVSFGFSRLFRHWQDISFQNLRAMGAFLVSAEQKGDKVQQITIYPEQGGTCRIALPASMQTAEPSVTGNQGNVTREGEILVIPTQKGQPVQINERRWIKFVLGKDWML